MSETVIFEKKYGVNINDFSTIEEIEKFIEKKEGKKLQTVKLDSYGFAHSRGSIFKLKKYNIDRMFNKAIKKNWLQHLWK
jgi:hypothetical protein